MIKYLEEDFENIVIYNDVQADNVIGKKRATHGLTGECIGNKLYLFSIENNSICIVNSSTGEVDLEYGDETKAFSHEYLYIKSISYNHIIYFISSCEKNILKYDVNSNQKEIISFKNEIMDYVPVIFEDSLFLFPMGYSENYIQISIESNEISYRPTNYRVQLGKNIQNQKYIFGKPVIVDEFLYRGCFLESCIQKINMKTGEFNYIKIKGFGEPIRNITFDGEFFWILSKDDSKIICWNENDNRIIDLVDLGQYTGKKESLYTFCSYNNGIIYIIERNGSSILKLDVKNKLLINCDCKKIPGFNLKRKEGQAFAEEIRVDLQGTVYFFPLWSNGIVAMKKDGYMFFYNTETVKRLKVKENDPIHNENTCTLACFCDLMLKRNKKIGNQLGIGLSILKSSLITVEKGKA